MDLVRLSNTATPYIGKFRPEGFVEGHSSLVWTERYFQAGDFIRESYDIKGTLRDLPITNPLTGQAEDTLVGLTDSITTMVVEAHKISKSLTGPPTIQTTGRTFETVLDRRTTLSRIALTDSNGVRQKQVSTINSGSTANVVPGTWTVNSKSASAAAKHVVSEVLAQVGDEIPELAVLAEAGVFPEKYPNGTDLPVIEYQVPPGQLYDYLAEQLQADDIGVVSKRPTPGIAWPIITATIYKGRDRSVSVSFSTDFDQLTSSDYILSAALWKNVSQVTGANGSVEVTDGTTRTGLAKRISYTDQTSVATQSVTGGNAPVLVNLLNGLGKTDLLKQPQTVMFSGEVSQNIAFKYDSMRERGDDPTTFYLGDVVSLKGDLYGSQMVRIAEFIRSQDASGESAYPTFVSLNAES